MYEDFPQKRRTPILDSWRYFHQSTRAHACNSDSAVLVSSPWCFRPRSRPGGRPGAHRVVPAQTQALLLQTCLGNGRCIAWGGSEWESKSHEE